MFNTMIYQLKSFDVFSDSSAIRADDTEYRSYDGDFVRKRFLLSDIKETSKLQGSPGRQGMKFVKKGRKERTFVMCICSWCLAD
jgi:hypothetical protein